MDIKAQLQKNLSEIKDNLIDLSHRIHAHPELAFKEEKASNWIVELLKQSGFEVEQGICDLPTAFKAVKGRGDLCIALCAEYDALPDIGHACGHNIIAAASVGAGILLGEIADDIGIKVQVIGTPAEENGGGKILLLERGGFKAVHAAMMVHPAPFEIAAPYMIAAEVFNVFYTGKEAHASAYPQAGINAADALTIAQTAIGLLRQHIRSTDRIHGIITKGGDAPNIIPAHTSAKYMIRSKTIAELDELRTKVKNCFEAGAIATGAKLEIVETHKTYAHVDHHPEMAILYQRNAEKLGRIFPDLDAKQFSASTDMGNISLAIPSIHPTIKVESDGASNHQIDFAKACISASGDQAILDGALAMAWTVIDIAQDSILRKKLQR